MIMRVCCDCKKILGYKPGPDCVSHGICDDCLDKKLKAMKPVKVNTCNRPC